MFTPEMLSFRRASGGAVYTRTDLDVTALTTDSIQDPGLGVSNPRGGAVTIDGSKFLWVVEGEDRARIWDLATANDMTDVSGVNDEATVIWQTAIGSSANQEDPSGLMILDDMKTFYLFSRKSDNVTKFVYSTALDYNGTTPTYDSHIAVGGDGFTSASGIWVPDDETGFYIAFNGTIGEYAMSTAGDLSTASLTRTQSISGAFGIWFQPDLSVCWVNDGSNKQIEEYSLSTPGDISTMSLTSSYSYTATASTCYGLTVTTDMQALVFDSANDEIVVIS